MPAQAPPNPSRGTLACYYAVQFGKTILWVAADLIAFYVLAVVEHLPAQDITLVLMGGLAWHALSDMAVGQWLERRGGDARGLAVIAGLAVPISCAAFVLSLLLAPLLPWAALMAMMLSRSTYALFDVPHHALIGRMARRGWPAVRIVGIRNLWGQVASLMLGLGTGAGAGAGYADRATGACSWRGRHSRGSFLAPDRDPGSTSVGRPAADEAARVATSFRLPVRIGAVLFLHLFATTVVATTSKVALDAILPGVALATLSAGRIIASVPLPGRWREQHIGVKLGISTLLLIVAASLLLHRPGSITVFGFGLASGWINILTWAWLGRSTDHRVRSGSPQC